MSFGASKLSVLGAVSRSPGEASVRVERARLQVEGSCVPFANLSIGLACRLFFEKGFLRLTAWEGCQLAVKLTGRDVG